MKKLIFLILAVAFSHTCVFSQGCLPEGISFQSQASVDSFQFNYPGCSVIEGDVFLNGDVFNLNGLSVLRSIEGSLTIDCVPLVDLTGLDSLKYIGGNLEFYATQLVNMTGLGSLDSIGGGLTIGCETNAAILCNSPFLVNLTGLENLKKIGGTLLIQHCESLSSLDGLSSLSSVSGITIKSNPILCSFTGLANVDAGSVSSLTISNNASLSQCHVQSICNYLSNPGGDVNIYGNAEGCRTPIEVANSCGFTLSCLPFGNYWLNSQADIDNFQTDYAGCTSLGGSVYIIGSDIANLLGLDSVTSIGGSLVIGHEWLGGGNPLLESLTGLGNIDSIGGTLHIQYNNLLENLSGFQNLNFIGGYLQLVGNHGLYNLSGLENLASIGLGLEISGNNGLTDLAGLENVANAGSYILIRLNDEMISLTGLDNIESGSVTELNIYYNDKLADCAVKSICEYLAAPNGTVEISGNATGCNSPEEVKAACGIVGKEELSQNNVFSVYPNPADSFITIETSSEQIRSQLSILNLNGQQLMFQEVTIPNMKIDISNIAAGVYIVRLVNERGTEVMKFIKY